MLKWLILPADMNLSHLTLLNFKNYEQVEFQFEPGVNCLTGPNGCGKTNILDAIHYLAFCKSYFTSVDSTCIRHDGNMAVIQGHFEHGNNTEKLFCALKNGQKKQFKRNQKEYSRLSDHIGLFPVVMVAPTDQFLITEGSDVRRRFMDGIISQMDKKYLTDLIAYNKLIQQRNALLKQWDERKLNPSDFEVWDEQIAPLGEAISSARDLFLEKFISVFVTNYNYISDNKEQVNLVYDRSFKEGEFFELLQKSLDRDKYIQYTSAGVHKDDLTFTLEGYPIKKFGSQGQQKSFVIALKLAVFQLLKEKKNIKPIVLLDDIFDKLDNARVTKLMDLVSNETFGQLFVTDTDAKRIHEIFDHLSFPVKIFELDKIDTLSIY